jgi:hypothetical protein
VSIHSGGSRTANESNVLEAVENAREMLRRVGYECGTTVEDLVLWFQADTPYDEGFGLDSLVKSPLLVAHELVEIERVKAMGLRLTKDVIVENMEKVDDAHLDATTVEIELALSLGELDHVNERMGHLGMWLEDPSVTEGNRRKYRELREKTLLAVEALKRREGA